MSPPDGLARPWGERLRTWREEIKGWSRDEFIDEVTAAAFRTAEARGHNLSPRLVARWESGEVQRPQGVYRRILAHMGAPLPQSNSHSVISFSSECLIADKAARKDENMEHRHHSRRRFIHKFSKTAAAIGSAGILSEPWQRLENVLTGRDHLNTDSVEAIQICTDELYGFEERYSSAHIIGETNVHLDTITGLIKGTEDNLIKNQLISQAGTTAALAGWLFYDQGDYVRAADYYRVAERAAAEVNNIPLIACVRAYHSYLAATQGSPGEAARFLQETLVILPRGQQPAMRAWLSARLAEEYAILGEHTDALRALDQAFLAYEFINERGDQPIWTRFFVPARLDGMAVASYARLNRPEMDAIAGRLLRTAVNPDTKCGNIARADLSYAYLERGDIERGANLCQQILDDITKSDTRVGYERLAVIFRTLSPYRSSRALNGLWEQLDGALRVHQ